MEKKRISLFPGWRDVPRAMVQGQNQGPGPKPAVLVREGVKSYDPKAFFRSAVPVRPAMVKVKSFPSRARSAGAGAKSGLKKKFRSKFPPAWTPGLNSDCGARVNPEKTAVLRGTFLWSST